MDGASTMMVSATIGPGKFSGERRILGVRVDPISLVDCVQWVADSIRAQEKNKYIAVVNVAKLVRAQKDDGLRQMLQKADLVGADGVPIVWVSGILGTKLPGRVAGIDLMYELLKEGDRQGWAFYFLGAEEEIIKKVVQLAKIQYPNVAIAGFRNGYFSEAEEPQVVKEIAEAEPNILFLGFGSPKKEHFVRQWLHDLNVNIVHGVGGSFDLFAGKTSRAPLWMQHTGLEWFYRLAQEPRRMFARYAVTNTVFVGLVIRELFRKLLTGDESQRIPPGSDD